MHMKNRWTIDRMPSPSPERLTSTDMPPTDTRTRTPFFEGLPCHVPMNFVECHEPVPVAVNRRAPLPSPRKRSLPPPADPQPHYPMPNRPDSRSHSLPSLGPTNNPKPRTFKEMLYQNN
uniref:Uncharacterized protein n=1 Tax=Romanomermis culicivorax TaxID=13658 RepID=A0A915K9E2_ROMCU